MPPAKNSRKAVRLPGGHLCSSFLGTTVWLSLWGTVLLHAAESNPNWYKQCPQKWKRLHSSHKDLLSIYLCQACARSHVNCREQVDPAAPSGAHSAGRRAKQLAKEHIKTTDNLLVYPFLYFWFFSVPDYLVHQPDHCITEGMQRARCSYCSAFKFPNMNLDHGT